MGEQEQGEYSLEAEVTGTPAGLPCARPRQRRLLPCRCRRRRRPPRAFPSATSPTSLRPLLEKGARVTRPSSLLAAAAEETDPGKEPLAFDQSTETEAFALTDACSAQPVEISVPSLLPPVRAVHDPPTGQSLQAATGGAGAAAHMASAGASCKRHRPRKKATSPS